MILGDWIKALLRERGVSEEDFLANLERGLAAGVCHRCDSFEPGRGCHSQQYYACTQKGGHAFFIPRPY